METTAFVAKSLFAGTESTEVLASLWCNVGVEFESDPASRSSTNGNIEVNLIGNL